MFLINRHIIGDGAAVAESSNGCDRSLVTPPHRELTLGDIILMRHSADHYYYY